MSRARPVVVLSEKQVERLADKLMATLGLAVIRFSQARATRQTPGIADRLYVNPSRRMAVWYEAKRVGGKQSEAQRRFEGLMDAVGWPYVCGTDDDLLAWCRTQGLCE